MAFDRRSFLKMALAAPAGIWLSRFSAFAQPHLGTLKITDIKAMELQFGHGSCIIKVETDGGIAGYGEAGVSGPMARARLQYILNQQGVLRGQDPLSIERIFYTLTSQIHPYMPDFGLISGIDTALWDIAGKVTEMPVCALMGGPFRSEIPMYSHGRVRGDILDPIVCRDWAQQVRESPAGFNAFKFGIESLLGITMGKPADTLPTEAVLSAGRAFENLREAAGDDIDIALHMHGEFDLPSAIAVGKAIAPSRPMFYEDPLDFPFSEAWKALKQETDLPILTGEKLEMVDGFRPFIDNHCVDIIHPDVCYAGGLTGTRKIAEYAAMHKIPVALHNVGTLVLCHATAHFAASIPNFYRSESALRGDPEGRIERMAASNPVQLENSLLKVPTSPGLGLDLDWDYIKSVAKEGEWWGDDGVA